MDQIGNNELAKIELLELVDQLNNAVEIAHLGLWEWDMVQDIIVFQEESFRIIGRKPDNAIHNMAEVVETIIHEESKLEFISSLEMIGHQSSVPNEAYRINHPTKEECWVKFNSRIIYRKGNPVKLIGVIMDVTEDFLRAKMLEENFAFIETLIESISSPIFYKNRAGIYKRFNRSFEEFLGLARDEIMDKGVYDIAPKELADVYYAADNELMESKGTQEYESLVETSSGEIRHVIFKKSAHVDDNGNVLGLVGLIQDVTEQRHAEQELERVYQVKEIFIRLNQTMIQYESEQNFLHDVMLQFMALFPKTSMSGLLKVDQEGILSIFDSHGLIVKQPSIRMSYKDTYLSTIVNAQYDKVHVINGLEMVKLSPEDPGYEVLEHNPIKSNIIIPILIENEVTWFFVYSSKEEMAFTTKDRAIAEYIRGEMAIIVRVYRMFEKTLQMARYDGLTGVMNRQYFDECFRRIIQEESSGNFAVILMDLDLLKKINDELGHGAGDKYLKLLGSLMQKYFAEGDIIGRLGGDEFAGIIFDKDEEQLEQLIEKMRVEYKHVISQNTNGQFESSFSYGIAYYPYYGKTYKELLKAADLKMYRYKKQQFR